MVLAIPIDNVLITWSNRVRWTQELYFKNGNFTRMTDTELFRTAESLPWRVTAPYPKHKRTRTVMCSVSLSSSSPSGGRWSNATKCCSSTWDKVLSCALSDRVFFPWGRHCWILVPVHAPPIWSDCMLFLIEMVKKYVLSIYYVLDMVICSEDKLMSPKDKS